MKGPLKFINLDLESYEGQVILENKLLPQCASNIRIKLKKLQQDPVTLLDEMIQTATNANQEPKKESKAQEREKWRRQGMLRCWPPSRDTVWKIQISSP